MSVGKKFCWHATSEGAVARMIAEVLDDEGHASVEVVGSLLLLLPVVLSRTGSAAFRRRGLEKRAILKLSIAVHLFAGVIGSV